MTSYTVGEVAELAGVTVRTLHHYDRIGLLAPGERAANGYRRYEAADLERLHRILSYRELGLGLDDIARLLDDPEIDPLAHLRRQAELLQERIARLEEMLAAVQTMMEAQQMDIRLTPEDRFELFGDFDPSQYAEEVEERWGGTDAYAESRRRAARYTKDDWRRIVDESGAIERGFVDALAAGEPPEGPRAMDLAERHRRHISRWFYDCGPAMHRGLAEMYVADARFRAHYEQQAAGLAQYVHDAMLANADRAA
jgi:MerR family transcriptional regulator, thiopeptide resistance regulator